MLSILVLASLLSTPIMAQVVDPNESGIVVPLLPELSLDVSEGGDDPIQTDDTGGPSPGPLPVDGGLSLLLAAGAAYGARRLRRRRD